MRLLRTVTGIVLLIAALAAAPTPAQIGEEAVDLLVPASDVREAGEQTMPASQRERTVVVRLELLEDPEGGPDDSGPELLRFELFPDLTLEAQLTRRFTLPRGGFAWTGEVAAGLGGEAQPGQVTLIVRDGRLYGSLRVLGHNLQIRPYEGGEHVVFEIDSQQMADDADDFIPVDLPGSPAPAPLGSDPIVDVLVVYTPAARAGAGGVAGMEALIDLGQVETNTSYANSGIDQRIRIVGTAEVAYTESGSVGTDLGRLRIDGDGFMDSVHTLRDTLGADIVSLWVESGGCGVGYLMTNVSTGFEDFAFNVCQRGCATGNLTFGHELGHNMAARHDWYVDDTPNSPYSYNHGFVNADIGDPGSSWRTVMAYNNLCSALLGTSCSRLLYFSNPDVSIGGVPAGVAEDTSTGCTEGNVSNPPCDADNRKTFNNTGSTVALFRPTQVLATISKAASSSFVNIGDTITYTLTVTNDSDLTATGVVLKDTVPDHTTLDPGSLSGDASFDGTDAGSLITWTTGVNLAPGASLVRTFSVTAVEGGIATNSATVESSNSSVVITSNTVSTTIWEAVDCGFSDGFESGALSQYWRVETTEDGRVRVLDELPDTGTYSAVLDDSVSGGSFSEASLIFAANLGGVASAELNFRWTDAGDEYHAAFDGVFIRESELDSWVKVFDFNVGGDLDFREGSPDLDQLAAANGLTLTDGFQVRFNFYDNFSFNPSNLGGSDGYAIDNVALTCACTSDADCDDGDFCNGAETCNLSNGTCQAGSDPCDDGVSCTVDSCNETLDTCGNVADDAVCDNGLFCDGVETCDPVQDCQAGSDPCAGGSCDEDGDVCEGGAEFKIQAGTVSVTHLWQTVMLDSGFIDPVVVAKPASYKGSDPTTVRIRNVTASSFEVRLQEWNYLNGIHGAEQVSFLAVERGDWQLAGGVELEAGSLFISNSLPGSDPFVPVSFAQAFSGTPVVVSVVGSTNGNDAVATRHQNVTTSGFEVIMQEEQALGGHGVEAIYWVAWKTGTGTAGVEGALGGGLGFEAGIASGVTHVFSQIDFASSWAQAPCFLADMQTTAGADPANLRYRGLTAGSVELQVDEETSADSETGHVAETVGYLAFDCSEGDAALPEFGRVSVTHVWQTVPITGGFSDPIVVAKPASYNGPDPTTVRLRNVSPSSFEIRLQEWNYLNGTHGAETVSYLVVERGSWLLPGGGAIEAGSLATANSRPGSDPFVGVPFAVPFPSTPVVFSVVGTDADADAVATRNRSVSSNGFETILQEEEAGGAHGAAETIYWIAWQPGTSSGGDPITYEAGSQGGMTHNFTPINFTQAFSGSPCFLADMQTFAGIDPATLRYRSMTASGVEVQVDDEQSADAETNHNAAETVGWVAFECP